MKDNPRDELARLVLEKIRMWPWIVLMNFIILAIILALAVAVFFVLDWMGNPIIRSL
jgi:hypothetical protein